jgi:hypothetical protein
MGAEEAIRSESGMLTLWDGRTEVDAMVFMAAADEALAVADRAACARTASLYPDELLPADRYEHWADEPRQRFRERRLAVFKGAGMWQQVLDLDPTDEQSHRELMRTHLRAGERRDAIRQFERLRDVLREHIGVGPGPETIAVYEQVLAAEGAEPRFQQRAAFLCHWLGAAKPPGIDAAERLDARRRDRCGRRALPGRRQHPLALVSTWTGRWYDVFRREFPRRWTSRRTTRAATYDANLRAEITGAMPGRTGHLCARASALAGPAGSAAGRAWQS